MSKTILAVEDDPQIAELLELLLESPDLRLLHYTSGREGLDAIMQQHPDLIILDGKLPEMTGWEVLDTIRQAEEFQQTPVLMLSVSQPEADRRHMFTQSKINFYMTKPFDVLKLRRQIKNILEVQHWQVGDSSDSGETGHEGG